MLQDIIRVFRRGLGKRTLAALTCACLAFFPAIIAAQTNVPAKAPEALPAPAPAKPRVVMPAPAPEPKIVPLPQRVGEPTEAEKAWGIEVVAIALTASASLVDLRYRVTDPEKAKRILDKDSKAYLIHQASGNRLDVPITKGGPMRQVTRKIERGRIYFVLFSNPANLVAPGDKVTLVIADMKVENVMVR